MGEAMRGVHISVQSDCPLTKKRSCENHKSSVMILPVGGLVGSSEGLRRVRVLLFSTNYNVNVWAYLMYGNSTEYCHLIINF